MRKQKTHIRKIRSKKWEITANTKESPETILRNCIPINWKILKKWTNS
jgi:hypothetical protein